MEAGSRFAITAAVAILFSVCAIPLNAQAALLMEEPYGFFGTVNPTGHTAVYLARVCAETPVKLRRCGAGEMGSVVSRYQGIDGYDWIAIPLVPYLYSVESPFDAPDRVNHDAVEGLRSRYRETHLMSLGAKLEEGNFFRGGWTELVGLAYQRRIYAFRFETTPEQDDALIAKLNADVNRSHYELFYNNCADFARAILDTYFPHTFRRAIFPDAGISTPKHIAYTLERYARKHPKIRLTILEIPLVPGFERLRRSNNGVAEAFFTTGYAVPLALINPYLAGGIFLDYVLRGHFHLIPRNPPVLAPGDLDALTGPARGPQNPNSVGTEAASAVAGGPAETQSAAAADSGTSERKATHEQE